MTHPPACVVPSKNDAVRIRIKAVAGAKHEAIAGLLGDQLKIKVSAPPEGGSANDAIRSVPARSLGVPIRDLRLVSGSSSRDKVMDVRGIRRDIEIRLQGFLVG